MTVMAVEMLHLQDSQPSKDAFIAAGVLPPLVAMLRSNHLDVQMAAVCTLGSLVYGSEQNKAAIIAAGAVPPLVEALRSQERSLQGRAAATLGGLAQGSQHSKDAVIAAGALPLLVAALRSEVPNVWEADHMLYLQTEAASALSHLVDGTQQSKDAVIAAGAVPLLVPLLRSTFYPLQREAARALRSLTTSSMHRIDPVCVPQSRLALSHAVLDQTA